MPSVHISSSDPLGKASAGVINLTSITPSTPRSFVEVLLSTGKYDISSLKTIKPLEQWDLTYELLDTASLSLSLGVAQNTSYLITALSCSCAPDKYPEVNVTIIKPSAANKIKANGSGVAVALVGGFGVVNKFGATSTAAFVSSQMSISLQTLEAMEETSGDFMQAGIYHFGFKQECQAEAYAAITIPAGAHAQTNAPTTPKETREGWQIYPAAWWTYLDATA
jgi:hypothetical protein